MPARPVGQQEWEQARVAPCPKLRLPKPGAMPAQTEHDAAGSAAGPGAGADDAQGGLSARRLVRDPVCGTHVAEVLAIPLREGGELVHFCSVACRDKYVSSAQRMAANG